MPLFRTEALRGQDTLHGEVSLVPPVGWQVLGLFLFASVAAAAVFVATAGYGKVTVVRGIVSADKGLARIVAPRAGTIAMVYVREDQAVAAAAPLARVDTYTDTAQGLVLSRIELSAPVAGVVTGLTAHVGDPSRAEEILMTVVPQGTRVEAALAVPPTAAGLLELRQPVRMAVDAFPYQTYGAVSGTVTTIARAAAPTSGQGQAFLVRASLPQAVWAYGAPHPLRPGMTLTARIRTRPRTLLAWMFDPVLAVQKR